MRACTLQERHILGYCKDLLKLQELLPHISSSNIVFASDGSHHRRFRRATCCWVISSKSGKVQCYGVSLVDGDLSSLNSFRAELEATRSLLYWLRLLLNVFSFTRPRDWHVVIWIDNSSALKYSKLDDFFKTNKHISNESDIINEIFSIKTDLHISLRGKHVKRHQTPERNVRAPLEVQLNEGCDGHAEDFLKTHQPNGTPPQQPPFLQPKKPP